jgi:hypothetical protein
VGGSYNVAYLYTDAQANDTFITCAHGDRASKGMNGAVTCTKDVTFVYSTLLHASLKMTSPGVIMSAMPALFTRMSSFVKVCVMCSTAVSMERSDVMSSSTAWIFILWGVVACRVVIAVAASERERDVRR